MYMTSEELLSLDPAQLAEAKAAYQRLPDYKIGAHGQLMEWQEDYDEPEPGHRHISHAFPLYPGWEINQNTPALMDALRVTLQRRLSHGGGHTGWSCAWLINLYARLGQGDRAADMIDKLLQNSTLDNLFDTHPPFQIDGNFGATAALAKMLLQSHTDTLDLLPALPTAPAYQSGSFYGLRARGGITVDAVWANGRITSCTLLSEHDTSVKLRVDGEIICVPLKAGEAKNLAFDQ
jgi:alpha-L-fucosidase 2